MFRIGDRVFLRHTCNNFCGFPSNSSTITKKNFPGEIVALESHDLRVVFKGHMNHEWFVNPKCVVPIRNTQSLYKEIK